MIWLIWTSNKPEASLEQLSKEKHSSLLVWHTGNIDTRKWILMLCVIVIKPFSSSVMTGLSKINKHHRDKHLKFCLSK
jgi:hypothetical protein